MSLLTLALTLTACTATSDDTGRKNRPPLDDTDTTDTDTTPPPPPPWTPESGTYVVSAETELKNTCGALSEEGGKGAATLDVAVNADATAFTLTGDDPVDTGSATTETNCPLTQILKPDIHYPFACEPLVATLNLSEFSLDGVINFSVVVDGTWTTTTHFDATNTGTVTCKGPDCRLVSEYLEVPFPCSVISTSAVDRAP